MSIPQEGTINEELKPAGTMIEDKIKKLEAKIKALEKANQPCSELRYAMYCFCLGIKMDEFDRRTKQ